ncbi:MAG: hypothetical protein RBR59_08240, partial [Sulfurimonadaceae bacterium]|nr:hypothetical protein [Sulfurimonadaceae bacterium]
MRILFVLLYTATLLLSDSNSKCSVVQLENEYNSDNIRSDACEELDIGYLAVRCGCYDQLPLAKEQLSSIKKDYKEAFLLSSNKDRFGENKKMEETCYSVQILSMFNSQKNFETLSQKSYPDECRLMKIETLAVKCDCPDILVSVEENKSNLKQYYDENTISTSDTHTIETVSATVVTPITPITTTTPSVQQAVVIEPLDEKEATEIIDSNTNNESPVREEIERTSPKYSFGDMLYNLSSNYGPSDLYGSIGLTYISNKYKNDRTVSTQENFMQEYKLGYNSYIYNPKLVDYSIFGALRYEDVKSEINDVSGKTEIKSKDYKVDFNFLKDSKIPFKIYAQQSDRPASILYANTVNNSLNNVKSAGVSGSIKLNIFDVTYSVSNSNGVYESSISRENRENKTYQASIRKNEKNYNFQLGFSEISQASEREYTNLDNIISNNKEQNLNLLYRLDINDDLTFNTYSYYRKNEYKSDETLSTTTTSATASLRWNPKTKHSGSISLQSFNTKDDSYTMQNMSMNQDYRYKITKDLTFSQQSDYSVFDTNAITSESFGLASGLSYAKPISDTIRINVSGNANIRSISSDGNTSLDADTYRYNIQTGISKQINSINSNLSANVGYDTSINTLDEYNKRYNTNLSFVTKISSKMSNNFSTNYYNE